MNQLLVTALYRVHFQDLLILHSNWLASFPLATTIATLAAPTMRDVQVDWGQCNFTQVWSLAIGHDLPPPHEVLSSATHCDHVCLGDISLKKGDGCERVWMLPKDLTISHSQRVLILGVLWFFTIFTTYILLWGSFSPNILDADV